MDILRVISRLLDYPDADIAAHRDEVLRIIAQAPLDESLRTQLSDFVIRRTAEPLLDWAADYDGLFERGRSLGLWLFEHVHGESRDRGQAMVDLVALYRKAGLELSQHELPDYIPLFLEFLATQGEQNARGWLSDMAHILALLQVRLEKRKSDYASLFAALLALSDTEFDLRELREQVSNEKRDDTREAIDKAWTEEEVKFGAESESGCETAVRRPSEAQRRDLDVPVNWVDFDTTPGREDQAVRSA